MTALEMKRIATMCGNNDALKKALKRLGWTQLDLARRSKISINITSDIINLGKLPTEMEANIIQMALGEAGEYLDVLELWPATFTMPTPGHERYNHSKQRSESLWDHSEAMQRPAPEYENEGLEEAMEMVLSRLSKRTYEVLKHRYWRCQTYEQIGDVLGVNRRMAQQIESHAFRLLKHHAWVRKLGPYMPRYLKRGAFVIRNDGSICLKIMTPGAGQKAGTDILIGDES
jgi:RNA polymerase sigma factor (sigma-70 family)